MFEAGSLLLFSYCFSSSVVVYLVLERLVDPTFVCIVPYFVLVCSFSLLWARRVDDAASCARFVEKKPLHDQSPNVVDERSERPRQTPETQQLTQKKFFFVLSLSAKNQ